MPESKEEFKVPESIEEIKVPESKEEIRCRKVSGDSGCRKGRGIRVPESDGKSGCRKARRKSGCRKARLGLEYASNVVVFAGPLSCDYHRKTRTLHSGDDGTDGMSVYPTLPPPIPFPLGFRSSLARLRRNFGVKQV